MTAILSIAMLMSVFGAAMVSASPTPSSPIVINGNSDLSVYPGTGTSSDPKVIANLAIDGSGGPGIMMGNVSMYVSINNCTIYNSTYGIEIFDSSNILIDNNTITGAMGTHGIYLYSTTASMDGNKLTDCSIELRHVDSSSGMQAYIDGITITSSNTVNGASVFFLKNQNMDNASVPSSAGEVVLLNVTYADVNGLNMHGGAVLFWCSHVTVQNNVVTGAYDAIYAFSSNQCTYDKNQIVDAWHSGVRLYQSSQSTVSNTTVTHHIVYSTAYGIVVMYSSNDFVADNSVRDTFDGLDLSHSTSTTISRNTAFHSLGEGIYVETSNGNTLSDNAVNGSSVKGISTLLSNNNILSNNTINGARNWGISLLKSFGNTVTKNTIIGSLSYGINLTQCNGAINLIDGNVLIGNNGANTTYSAANVQAFDDNSNHWNNGAVGNYWGDWTAPDANHDGIVDSAYAIAGGLAADSSPVALSVNILSPDSSYYTNATSVSLSGTTTGYVLNNVAWHNAASGASGQGSGTAAWTATVGLVTGINDITVTATDSQGLTASDNVTVVYATANANLTIVSPVSNSYNNTGSVLVQWTASNAISGIAKTEISTDGAAWTTVTGNSIVLTLADGHHTVQLKVTDRAGNVNQTSVTFTVDKVKPVVAISSPSNGTTNTTGSVTVQWTASDVTSGIANTEISTDGTNWTTVTGNSHVLTLSDGPYTVYVKATDKAGNFNQTSVSFTVESSTPTVVAKTPIGSGVSKRATIAVLFSEPMNKTATMIVVSGVTGAISWNHDNATFTPTSVLAYNTVYTVTVNGKDLSGKALNATTWTFTTMKDEGKITCTISDSNGNAVVGATVSLSNGMNTTTDATGYFEFDNVTSGSYVLTITKDGFKTVTQNVSAAAGETTIMAPLSAQSSAANASTDYTLPLVAGVIVILALLGTVFLVMKRRKK